MTFVKSLHRFCSYHPAFLLALCLIVILSGLSKSDTFVIRSIYTDAKGQTIVKGREDRFRLNEKKMDQLALLLEEEGGFGISPLTRFEWKESIKASLRKRFKDGGLSDLFASLLLGTPLPSSLQGLFKKTGLLHLVAISGFHFSLLRGFLFYLLGFVLTGKGRHYGLILFLGGYALLLGGVPSVLRAFFSSIVVLLGELFNRRSKSINTFGLSLLLTLIVDRELLFELSFQMSFGITFAILTLYPWMVERISFPKLKEVRTKKPLHQCYLLLRTGIEKSVIFSFAVTAVALPLSLLAFGSFPCFGLFINLIFTPLFSLLVGAILLATLFPFLDPMVYAFGELVLSGLSFFDRPLPVIEASCSPFLIMTVLVLLTGLAVLRNDKSKVFS